MAQSRSTTPRWKLPDKFAKPLKAVQSAVTALQKSAGHKFLKFTLDGRLIGDLGEAIAEHFFQIRLHGEQQCGHDAVYQKGEKQESVEIKIRRKSSLIWFDSQPDHLIVFLMEPGDTHVSLAYAGPGDVLRKIRPNAQLQSPTPTKSGASIHKFTERQTVSLNQLATHFDYEAFMRNPIPPFNHSPEVVR